MNLIFKLKNLTKIFLLGAVSSLILIPATGGQGNNLNYIEGNQIPQTSEPRQAVVRDRVERDTSKNSERYKQAQRDKTNRQKVLNEVFDPMVLMTPITRAIRPVDSIGLSPSYITQIVFPNGFIVTDGITSFKTKVFQYNRNIIRLRPDFNTFYGGNIVVTLTNGKKNYTMNIFAERYYKKDCVHNPEDNTYICTSGNTEKGSVSHPSDKYASSFNNLSTMYKYVNPSPIEDMEVISLYENMEQGLLNIKTDGDFVFITYDNIKYKIQRNDQFGSQQGGIMYRGIGYIVTTAIN